MAAAQKFYQFVQDVAHKVHHLGSDTLKVALCLTAPVATNAVFGDLTEISPGNGYTAGGVQSTQSGSAQMSGVYKLTLADVTYTASSGSLANFRYPVLYNSTPTSPLKPLILFWDYGATITVTNGNSFTVDFSATNGVATIT